MKQEQMIGIAAIALVVVGIGSWKASTYVNDNDRIRADNVALRAEVADLKKDLEKCQPQRYPGGWRPGAPIGSTPTGAPLGSTPSDSK